MKYRVWQVGWEDEARVIEVSDPDECVTCEAFGGFPDDADPIVAAFCEEGADPTGAKHRLMGPSPLGGIVVMCRDATPEEIERARDDAQKIKSGELKEISPLTPEEQEMRRSTARMMEPLVGGFLSVFGTNNAQRMVGVSMINDWAMRQGLALADKIGRDTCTCGEPRSAHENWSKKEIGGCEKSSCKKFEKAS